MATKKAGDEKSSWSMIRTRWFACVMKRLQVGRWFGHCRFNAQIPAAPQIRRKRRDPSWPTGWDGDSLPSITNDQKSKI